MRERLSLCRRDIAKLIATALEEGVPGDWPMVQGHFRDLIARIPRSPDIHDITPIVEEIDEAPAADEAFERKSLTDGRLVKPRRRAEINRA